MLASFISLDYADTLSMLASKSVLSSLVGCHYQYADNDIG